MRQHKAGIYEKYIKRLLDFVLSLMALMILSPVLLVLIIVGAIKMRGNPFFTQQRPGKEEKIFKLIKFRSMTNETDDSGNLLPDEKRLLPYGKFLRKTSLDELPELINILKGDLAIVGPRPLVPQYLPYYTSEERRRHDVRPGLTGWAQVNGRNNLIWEERFAHDVYYVSQISFKFDLKIIFLTAITVFKKENVTIRKSDGSMDFDAYRKAQWRVKEK